MPAESPIYHLVPETELRPNIEGDLYSPPNLANDGFVHCAATRESVLAVANDYFSAIDDRLLLLRIEPERLRARLVFEAAAPLAGAPHTHLETAERFPHVYGPIDLEAISGVGVLERSAEIYRWPVAFEPLASTPVIHRFLSEISSANRKQENSMIELRDKESGRSLGSITAEQLQFLTDQLEEESADDHDYYINSDTLDLFVELGIDAPLLELLQRALGEREEMEIEWVQR